jgi:hypothetical protein
VGIIRCLLLSPLLLGLCLFLLLITPPRSAYKAAAYRTDGCSLASVSCNGTYPEP